MCELDSGIEASAGTGRGSGEYVGPVRKGLLIDVWRGN